MKLDRLQTIRFISAVLAVLLLIAGAVSVLNDYNAWKTANAAATDAQTEPLEISESAVPAVPQGGELQCSADENGEKTEIPSAPQPDDGTAEMKDVPDAGAENAGPCESGSDAETGENADTIIPSVPPAAGNTVPQIPDGKAEAEGIPAGTETEENADPIFPSALPAAENSVPPIPDGKADETEEIPSDAPADYNAFVLSAMSRNLLILAALCAAVSVGAGIAARRKNGAGGNVNGENCDAGRGMPPVIPAEDSSADASVGRTVSHAEFNQIGKRQNQEDCCGVLPLENGVMAVVADGMGGLKGGERVSELAVRTMMEQAQSRQEKTDGNNLLPMLFAANDLVNRTLGADVGKSGSTLLAVWIQGNGSGFHWVTVGDSRIYLYRGGSLIQLNQEHTLGQELLNMAVNGRISFDEARNSTQKAGLTSFLGMGKLKYVDYSVRPIVLQAGDRILLMSDGVFNSVPDERIAQVLHQNPDVKAAAAQLVLMVEQENAPKQDNYTAVILGV